jgi:predicted PurR-regulated permease PerM
MGTRSRRVWGAAGLLLGLVVVFVAWSFVGTFVFAVFIYYSARPIHRRLRRRMSHRGLAAAASLLVVSLPAVLLLGYTLAVALREFESFSERYDAGQLEEYVDPYLDLSEIVRTPEEIASGGGVDALVTTATSAGQYLGVIGIGLLHLFVMIAVAFYLLRDDHRLAGWITRRFGDDAGLLKAYLRAVDRSYSQIFFGNILNAVITGVIGALSYSLLDIVAPAGSAIPYPVLLGLLAGLASLVPLVGMKLVYVPAAVYLFAATIATGDGATLWFPVGFVLVSFVVVDTIPDLVLRPYVSGRNLHVGMVMLAYVLGPFLFGWYGLFLAPMILVVVVHFARIVLPELARDRPARPAGTDPGNATGIETGEATAGSDADNPDTRD